MIYRLATGLAGPALRAAAPLTGGLLRERLALDAPVLARGGIWIHAASVGELNSARAVIEALAAYHAVVVTTNSVTGRAVARGWGLPAHLAPLDVPGAVRRFLDAVRPVLMVTVENEIWPNRAAEARRRAIPQAVIGARMSERSARGWGRARGLIGPVLAGLELLSAQDADTESRLRALGLPQAALAGRLNLKLLGPAAIRPGPEGASRDRLWLAASTHPGEERAVLAAHAALAARIPGLRLILAPRHPRRAAEVAALAVAAGFTPELLGAREVAAAGAPPVLLIDRLGALGGAYAAAGVCLTGGSLADHGGHTPWEPAAHRCALLHGSHVANFRADYALLDAEGAARLVTPGTLAERLGAILSDPGRRRAMGQAARRALDAAAPDPAPLVARLLALAEGARGDAGATPARFGPPPAPDPNKLARRGRNSDIHGPAGDHE